MPEEVMKVLLGCSATEEGYDYMGRMEAAGEGHRCLDWQDERVLSASSVNLADSLFPEASIREAQNFCRNPYYKQDSLGPWCFHLEGDALLSQSCYVPWCLPQGNGYASFPFLPVFILLIWF